MNMICAECFRVIAAGANDEPKTAVTVIDGNAVCARHLLEATAIRRTQVLARQAGQ